MVKSRKSKAKNSDFQKVKLKIGKKLPRGLNETNASFKSTSIQLKEQLKHRDSSLPQTRRKRSLDDVLSQCGHYSGSVRAEALLGLSELGKASSRLFLENLPIIIEKISALILDKEFTVRQKLLPLFKQIFESVSMKQISPFFPLLTSHTICAMTHLTEEIQQDSLPVLDICLLSYPELMVDYSDRLLSCFIKQIASPSNKSNEKYALITNPSSRRSTQSWRNKVLNRLHKVLAIHIQKNKHQKIENRTEVIKLTKGYHYLENSTSLSERNISCININKLSDLNENNLYQDFHFSDLMKLLLQCWIEAKPDTSSQKGSSLSQDCVDMLESILGIVELYNQSHDSRSSSKEIIHHFMPFFPFSLKKEPLKNRKKEDSVSIDAVNMKMCHILCLMENDYSQHLPMVTSYLGQLIQKKTSKHALLNIIHKLVMSSPRESKKLLDKCEDVFVKSQVHEEKKSWLSFFLTLSYQCNESDSAWFNIADICVRNILQVVEILNVENTDIIDKVLTLVNKYTSRKKESSVDIISHLVGKLLRIGGIWGHNHELTYKLITLMYWLPSYDEDLLKLLKPIFVMDNEVGCYFLELMEHKMTTNINICPTPIYISFLFSLLRCEKDTCYFVKEPIDSSAAMSLLVKQVKVNLFSLNNHEGQLRYLHECYHDKVLGN